MMTHTVGIYRSEDKVFGFFTPEGEYLSPMSRAKARSLAKEYEVSATSQGVFIPDPVEEAPVSTSKRRYVKHGFKSHPYGTVMFETSSKEDATRFYMAAYMYRRKHPEYNFARVVVPGDTIQIVFVAL